jgi:hypothetical protein
MVRTEASQRIARAFTRLRNCSSSLSGNAVKELEQTSDWIHGWCDSVPAGRHVVATDVSRWLVKARKVAISPAGAEKR